MKMAGNNYHRFRYFNKHLFAGKLPKIKIIDKKTSKDLEASFIYTAYSTRDTYIVVYGPADDKIMIHEMVHYYLYMKYIYKRVKNRPRKEKEFYEFLKKINKIKGKVFHTKEFWKIYSQKVKRYEKI